MRIYGEVVGRRMKAVKAVRWRQVRNKNIRAQW
jgi:hypothetical protein